MTKHDFHVSSIFIRHLLNSHHIMIKRTCSLVTSTYVACMFVFKINANIYLIQEQFFAPVCVGKYQANNMIPNIDTTFCSLVGCFWFTHMFPLIASKYYTSSTIFKGIKDVFVVLILYIPLYEEDNFQM